jgi:hypothetical protein
MKRITIDLLKITAEEGKNWLTLAEDQGLRQIQRDHARQFYLRHRHKFGRVKERSEKAGAARKPAEQTYWGNENG